MTGEGGHTVCDECAAASPDAAPEDGPGAPVSLLFSFPPTLLFDTVAELGLELIVKDTAGMTPKPSRLFLPSWPVRKPGLFRALSDNGSSPERECCSMAACRAGPWSELQLWYLQVSMSWYKMPPITHNDSSKLKPPRS